MIDRMQRTARDVGRVVVVQPGVVVLPGVVVERVMAVVGRGPMMLVFDSMVGSELDADPWERTERRKYERGEGE